MKDVGKFYDHLVYFIAITFIVWPLCMFFGHFCIFSKKIWQPCSPKVRPAREETPAPSSVRKSNEGKVSPFRKAVARWRTFVEPRRLRPPRSQRPL
jgi:hypothetical protein